MSTPLWSTSSQSGTSLAKTKKPRFHPLKTLAAYWSHKEDDMNFHYPTFKGDGGWLNGWFYHVIQKKTYDWETVSGKSFMEELRDRGFDLKTLRFTVEIDPTHPRWAESPTVQSWFKKES